MYTIVENARIVIALLKAHNIRHIVLSPGGSNIPIVQGVQDDPFFRCYSVVDERSAMYIAIGIYLQTGELVATSCTSAQATRNYVPGLTEAFYKRVPILAITMSKHPRYIGQEYMQCPVQTSLPIDSVKKSFSLPIISTEDDRQLCIRTVNEAILELTHHNYGPVQLNIEALDSETWSISENSKLPEIRAIKRIHEWDDLKPYWLNGKKTMVLIGEHMPFSQKEITAIERFCDNNNAFVYTTHISNYNGKYSLNGVPIIVGATKEYYKQNLEPEIIITLGGVTGDYDCFNKISGSLNPSLQVWRVNNDGNVIDTYGKLTVVFQMGIEYFFNSLSKEKLNKDHQYYNSWLTSKDQIHLDSVNLPLSNIFTAQMLHEKIPANSYLNFAILNSFRSWLFFDLDPSIKSFCNVGAFGIDGCLSTMLGQSFTTDELCFLITGDLAFYYDMNSIALRNIKNNVRILLINNNGGAEFKINSIHLKTDVSRYIAADNHFKNAKTWTEDNGFKYFSVQSKEEFLNIIDQFVSPSERPMIIEVFTEAENQRKAISLIRHSCINGYEEQIRNLRKKDSMKNVVNNIIGQSGTDAIRNIIKRIKS